MSLGVLGEAGFYGPVWRNFVGANGPVDQINRLLKRLTDPKHMYRRTNFVTSWDPSAVETADFGHTMSCVPCHATFQVIRCKSKNIFDQDVLHLILKQRSCDLPVGGPYNMYQYAVLLLMLAQVTGCRAGIFTFQISDCHIYGSNRKKVEELVKQQSFPFPEVHLNPDVTDLFNFTVDDVELRNYQSGSKIFFKVVI